MQLTKHTDIAFRALIYLAAAGDQRANIVDIADRFQIPKSHLMKVISSLVAKGYVSSKRGKSGGVCLGRPASEINLRDIVVAMETTLDPINCETHHCIIMSTCLLKPMLNQARDAYLDTLARYTLADVLDPPTTNIILPSGHL